MIMTKDDINKDNKIWYLISLICFYILRFFLGLFHKELTKKSFDAFMQFVKFGIVGLSNTILSYLIYAGVLYLFENNGWLPKYDYLVASVLAFILSVLWSFFWNSRKVFVVEEGEKRAWFPALIKTYVAYSFTGLFLGNVLLIMWVKGFHISKYIAPLINLVVTIPINFVINKFWAFKTKKPTGKNMVSENELSDNTK
jgi:putative flippase GtrA